MNKSIVIISFIFSLTFAQAQEVVWNDSKTIGLVPQEKWVLVDKGEVLTFHLKGPSFRSLKGLISISTSPSNNMSLEKLWEMYVLEGFPKLLSAYKEINQGRFRIDSNLSRWIEYTNESEGVKFQGLSATFVEGDLLYIVTCNSSPEYYKSVKDDFFKMMNTIVVK